MSNEELARAWMAWRIENAADYDEPMWLEGMRNDEGYLVADASHDDEHPPPKGQVRWYGTRLTDWVEPDEDDGLPDMDWPPNIAYLIIDARRAHGRQDVQVEANAFGWQFTFPTPNEEWKVYHPTEASAWVAALRAAPEPS